MRGWSSGIAPVAMPHGGAPAAARGAGWNGLVGRERRVRPSLSVGHGAHAPEPRCDGRCIARFIGSIRSPPRSCSHRRVGREGGWRLAATPPRNRGFSLCTAERADKSQGLVMVIRVSSGARIRFAVRDRRPERQRRLANLRRPTEDASKSASQKRERSRTEAGRAPAERLPASQAAWRGGLKC